jgi:YHS domain-containing protein
MKSKFMIALMTMTLGLVELVFANHAFSQEKSEKATAPAALVAPKCPVTGNPANLAVSAPTLEGPVFFCCKDCIAKFRAEPNKFAEAVAAQRAALSQRPKVQVKCPVSGDPPDPKITLETGGRKVAFCSEDCRKKYAAEPGKYASALANAYTYQTICPVMKEPIDPATFIKLPSGDTVYICCKGCDKKLLADPVKYAPILQEQGYTFDFSKTKKDDK